MTDTAPLNANPKWHAFLGYSHGLSQASMMTKEVFPLHANVREVNTAFNILIAQVMEDEETPPITKDHPVAAAQTLAGAVARLQNWIYIPAADEHVVSVERSDERGTQVQLVLPYWNMHATDIAYKQCARIWNRLFAGDRFEDVTALRLQINKALAPFVSKSVNEFAQVKGITELGFNLIRMPGDVLCVGTGARSRLLKSTLTDRTPSVSMALARNKFQTALLLRNSGLPGTRNKLVSSADEALAFASDDGGAVVIKPADLDRGDGVAADLCAEAEIRDAFNTARSLTHNVLVEEHVTGFTHRLTVVEGEVVSVRQRIPGGVTGDGRSTVAELVRAHKNTTWSRRWARIRGRVPVDLDTEAFKLLAKKGMGAETILPNGQFQRLRQRDNINAGGRNRDVPLEEVHLDNLDLAVSAARVIRLDIAGIDLITDDIAQSWRECGAKICEINGKPQFAARHTPELYHALLSRIVGPEPHVPADLILCNDDPAERAALVKTVEARSTNQTISTREGLVRNGALLTGSFSGGYGAAWAAAVRSDVEAMTCVMSVSELFRLGSPLRTWSTVRIHQVGLSDPENRLLREVHRFLGTS